MWHQITLPVDFISEIYSILTTMSYWRLSQGIVDSLYAEMYGRSLPDGAEVLYLNDAALQLYRDSGGTRTVEATMQHRPPDAHQDDILLRERLLFSL